MEGFTRGKDSLVMISHYYLPNPYMLKFFQGLLKESNNLIMDEKSKYSRNGTS